MTVKRFRAEYFLKKTTFFNRAMLDYASLKVAQSSSPAWRPFNKEICDICMN